MVLCLTPRIEQLTARITGRQRSLFADDIAAQAERIAAAIAGRRLLVVGGAGSIGAATIATLLAWRPAALAVLDIDENNLTELVRHLRSSAPPFAGELQVAPLDYGSALARAWLSELPPADLVLSFAALKHVRSERDRFSLLRMLEVNVLAAARFLAACRDGEHGRMGVFFVSTDKAAAPTSLMGASKRAMELLLWAQDLPRATTARFANVAFSDGSLPWGFLQRLEKRQPLAGPHDVRRWLISPREAGELCALAACCAPHRHVLVPRLRDSEAVDFVAVARAVLAAQGLEPALYEDEDEARRAVEAEAARGRWPLVCTPTTTSGEKAMETFVAPGETASECGLGSCQAVPAPAVPREALESLLALLAEATTRGQVPTKAELIAALAAVVPELRHHDTGQHLDGKM